MAGKLLNSCYFYVVLAHIPAGGLCTNQQLQLLPPWFGGVRLYIIPQLQPHAPWEGCKLQPLQLLEWKGSQDPDVVPQKGVKSTKLLFVGFYSLSLSRCHKWLLRHSSSTSADPWALDLDLAIGWVMKMVLCRCSLCIYWTVNCLSESFLLRCNAGMMSHRKSGSQSRWGVGCSQVWDLVEESDWATAAPRPL